MIYIEHIFIDNYNHSAENYDAIDKRIARAQEMLTAATTDEQKDEAEGTISAWREAKQKKHDKSMSPILIFFLYPHLCIH